MNSAQVCLPTAAQGDFGRKPMLATHNLHEHELFGDEALAELLDRFPRRDLYALTMGHDLTRPNENRLALHDGVSGRELLRAVRNGRLWLNITRVDRADSEYKRLIEGLYEQLAALVPEFDPLTCQGTLLISSPHALVYYHADGPASVLWHIRGRKRVWIYPALVSEFATRESLEDIFAGLRHEYLPYHPSFDSAAVSYELAPGQWVAWPQNAPHRVTNMDSVNVSLSTEHYTVATRRRQRVYIANRFMRSRLRIRNLSAKETGLSASAKTLLQRVANKLKLDPIQYRSHVAEMRVDADAPEGVIALTEQSAFAHTASGSSTSREGEITKTLRHENQPA